MLSTFIHRPMSLQPIRSFSSHTDYTQVTFLWKDFLFTIEELDRRGCYLAFLELLVSGNMMGLPHNKELMNVHATWCQLSILPIILKKNLVFMKEWESCFIRQAVHFYSHLFLSVFTHIIYKYRELQEWWIKYETSGGYCRRELSRRVVNHCATGMISITILWHLLWKPSAYAVFWVPQRHFLNHNLSS